MLASLFTLSLPKQPSFSYYKVRALTSIVVSAQDQLYIRRIYRLQSTSSAMMPRDLIQIPLGTYYKGYPILYSLEEEIRLKLYIGTYVILLISRQVTLPFRPIYSSLIRLLLVGTISLPKPLIGSALVSSLKSLKTDLLQVIQRLQLLLKIYRDDISPVTPARVY